MMIRRRVRGHPSSEDCTGSGACCAGGKPRLRYARSPHEAVALARVVVDVAHLNCAAAPRRVRRVRDEADF